MPTTRCARHRRAFLAHVRLSLIAASAAAAAAARVMPCIIGMQLFGKAVVESTAFLSAVAVASASPYFHQIQPCAACNRGLRTLRGHEQGAS